MPPSTGAPAVHLSHLFAEALRSEQPAPIHCNAMLRWVEGKGTPTQLHTLAADGRFFAAMVHCSGMTDFQLGKWFGEFWEVAKGLDSSHVWQQQLLWNAREFAGLRPDTLKMMGWETEDWSTGLLEPQPFAGVPGTNFTDDDVAKKRTFLEFAIRHGLNAENIIALTQASWHVTGERELPYTLLHGRISAFEDLVHSEMQYGDPLDISDEEWRLAKQLRGQPCQFGEDADYIRGTLQWVEEVLQTEARARAAR